MGTGYTRNDTSNNIADGNIINAADLDGEFDAIESAFGTSGHTHDGTSAEGGPITVLGPVQDFVASATEIKPKTTNTLDIGTNSLLFKDMFLDGVATIGSIKIDNAGTIGSASDADAIAISSGGVVTFSQAPLVDVTNATTNAVTDVLGIQVQSSGTPAVGIGSGLTLGVETAAGNVETAGAIRIVSTGLTPTDEEIDLVFYSMRNGSLTEAFRFDSDTDSLRVEDSVKVTFGNSQDLQIYHDGSGSRIYENGTGILAFYSNGSGINFYKGEAAETMLTLSTDGAVTAYYDGSEKLATTSTGIDVTGRITTDAITEDTSGNVGIGTNSPDTLLHLSGADTAVIRLENSDSSLGTDQIIGGLEFEKTDGSGAGAGVVGGVRMYSEASLGQSTYLAFSTASSSTNNVERMRISSTGVVDIGSTGGAGSGNVILSMAGGVGTQNGTAAAPTHTFYSDPDTGMFRTAANILGFSAGGTEYAQIGSFGIAADQIVNKTASGNLTVDVAGTIILDADTQGSGNGILLKDGGTLYGSIFRSSSHLHIKAEDQDKNLIFMGNDGGSEITALTLDMSQAGEADFNSAIKVSGGIVAHQTNKGVLEYSSNNFQLRSYGGSAGSGQIQFKTGGGGGSTDTLAMTIDNNQNVGIGDDASSPSTPLMVRDSTDGALIVANTTAAGGQGIGFFTDTTNNRVGIFNNSSSTLDMVFNTGGTATSGEAMRIDNATKNVGIGATLPSPDYGSDTVLEVSGSTSPGIVINDTGQASKYGIHADSNDLKITYGSGALVSFQNDGNVGIGTSDPHDAGANFHMLTLNGAKGGGIVFSDDDVNQHQIYTTDDASLRFARGSGLSDETMRIHSTGSVQIGGSTNLAKWFNADGTYGTKFIVDTLQDDTDANYMAGAFTLTKATTAPAYLALAHNRGSSYNSVTSLSAGDGVGAITFQGADGTTYLETGRIESITKSGYGSNTGTAAMEFYVNTGSTGVTKKMTLQSTGDLELENNLVIGTSGKGIDFSATSDGSGTTSSELLDDYEEGTFSPTYVGTSTSITATLDSQVGFYTKIGDTVFFRIHLGSDAVSGGSSSNLQINGLPFATNSGRNFSGPVGLNYTWGSNNPYFWYSDANTSFMYLYKEGGSNVVTNDLATGANSNRLWIQGQYKV